MRSFMPLARPGDAPGAGPPAGTESDSDPDLRLTVLLRTIEHEIVPRLMLAHRSAAECVALPADSGEHVSSEDVDRFARLVLSPDESLARIWVHALRARGTPAERICTELLAPVARRLGVLWEQDLCEFTDVTLGLGRLHQTLRELSPAFDVPADAPANGRRILLAPAPGEDHTFGLVMVSEFFRRAGWEVAGVLGDASGDTVSTVRREWFDIVGYSMSAEIHLDRLRECIAAVRRASMNPRIGIMVGGPLFLRYPGYVSAVGADAMAETGDEAPGAADRLATGLMPGRLPVRPS